MPFKIISTIEKGRSVLTTVPSDWEREGFLFWPRLVPIKVEKLRRSERSKPEEDWKVVNCILKRRHLSTFENAELELERMCSNSDTETDNEKENKTVYMKTQRPSNFEKIVQECINSTDTDSNSRGVSSRVLKADKILTVTKNRLESQVASVSEEPQVISVYQEPQLISVSQEPRVASVYEEHLVASIAEEPQALHDIQINNGLVIDNTLVTKIDNLITNVNTIQENQAILQGNINIILENQKLFFEGQQLMMLNLSQTVTQLEEYINKSSGSTKKTESVDFIVIQDHEQLRSFEHLLENSEQELQIKIKLSTICGKGKGRGINNAYALIDAMFDRNFLKTCSWAGGSRTTETKLCFKSFTKVIKLFFDVVHDSDNSFTVNECHNFFKNVLKNSSQRCNSKKMRTSTTKHRPKKKANVNTNNILTEVSAEADKNKTISGGPQSNLRMPLKDIEINNTPVSFDFEVYV